jgi:hypothetical protein
MTVTLAGLPLAKDGAEAQVVPFDAATTASLASSLVVLAASEVFFAEIQND